jgi:hypothetical protein
MLSLNVDFVPLGVFNLVRLGLLTCNLPGLDNSVYLRQRRTSKYKGKMNNFLMKDEDYKPTLV